MMRRLLVFLPFVGLGLSPSGHAQTVANFALPDINPKSVRYTEVVSPDNYRLQVSAYYFGSAG